jgi:hypothetical protein
MFLFFAIFFHFFYIRFVNITLFVWIDECLNFYFCYFVNLTKNFAYKKCLFANYVLIFHLAFIYFKFFKIHCKSCVFICKLCIASIFHLPQPPTVVYQTCRFTFEKFIFIRLHLKASSLALAVGFLSYAKQEDIL